MRRRLDLAMTLVGDPRVIFLDEPTTGLDPRSRRTMWQIIRELVAGGVTIFLTTQYLDEADQLADRIAVLDHGRLVAEGTPDELKRRIPGGHVRLRFADPPRSTRRPALGRRHPRRRGAHPAGAQRRRRPVAAAAARPARRRLDRGRRAVRAHPRPRRRLPRPHRHPTEGSLTPDELTPPPPTPCRLGDDAAPQPAAHAALPVADLIMRIGMPVIFLLLFVYVFGGTLGAGLGGGGAAGRVRQLRHPGILLMTVAARQGTAISVAMDMTEGIIARFRTMAIARPRC
jgi:hypothetical protein